MDEVDTTVGEGPLIAAPESNGLLPVRRDGTRERILDAALAVLRDVGHGGFSVQKVAREAGVYQGNITYYWPRRQDLVRALAVRLIEDYRTTYLARFALEGSGQEGRGRAFIRWMVEDAVTQDRVRLMPELWSMANADPQIAADVARCSDEVVDALLDALGVTADRPCVGAVRIAVRVAGAAAQGLTVIHGHRGAQDAVTVEVMDALITLHTDALARALATCDDR